MDAGVGFKISKAPYGRGGFPLSPSNGDRYYRDDMNLWFTWKSSAGAYGKGLWLTERHSSLSHGYNSPTYVPVPLTGGTGAWNVNTLHTFLHDHPADGCEAYIEDTHFRTFQTIAGSGVNFWQFIGTMIDVGNGGYNFFGFQATTAPASFWSNWFNTIKRVVPYQYAQVFYLNIVNGGNPGNLWHSGLRVFHSAKGPDVPMDVLGPFFGNNSFVMWFSADVNQYQGTAASLTAIPTLWGRHNVYSNLAQGTVANQPIIVHGGPNGWPILRFDGSNDWMGTNTYGTCRHVWVVARHATGTSAGYENLLGNTAAAPAFHGDIGTNLLSSTFASSNVLTGSGWVNNVVTSPASMQKSTSWKLYEFETAANVTIDSISNDRSTAGRFWNGDFAEVIVSSSAALSAAVRSKVTTYLMSKYGLS